MREIHITHHSDTGQRLDKFVKKYLPNAPLGGIYKMLRVGKIKVNGKKKDPTHKIELEDTIQLFLSDEEIQGMKYEVGSMKQEMENQEPRTKNQELFILHEDEDLLVVNKPAGINVHPGDHKTKEVSLIERVQDYLEGKYDSLTFRPSLVHRIDRDTSGCIIIAKNKETLESLLQELQNHQIEKIYHAIVLGIPEKTSGTIRAKILRLENAKDEAKVRIDEAGQSAITHFKTVGSWKLEVGSTGAEPKQRAPNSQQLFSLLECRIETGRTHQIRVHLASIHCPILGDKAYGNRGINSFLRRNFGVDRQLLHACELKFIHPKTKKTLEISAPYPEDFRRIIHQLEIR